MKNVLRSLDWFWIALGILTLLFAVKLSMSARLDLQIQLFFLFSLAFMGKGFRKVTSNKIHIYSKIIFVVFLGIIFIINLTGG